MFNITAFNENIIQAQKKFDLNRELPEEIAYEREQGLRFIIETGISRENVRMRLRDVMRADFLVEPLFTEDGNQTEDRDLARFYLLTFPHVVRSDIQQNIYDAAYYIRNSREFDGVEPDLPYQKYWGSTTRIKTPTKQNDYGWALRNINAKQAWHLNPKNGKKDGEGISIAHLDSGWADHDDLDSVNFDQTRFKDFIDKNNPDAKDPLNYPGNPGHGTKTGSVIMSRGGLSTSPPFTTNPGQITGVARKSTYISVRCIKKVWFIYGSHIAQAIDYARYDRSDVISMSLGGFKLKALFVAVQKAVGDDMLVLAAAGNNVRLVVYPARYQESIAVAATNIKNKPWNGTSRGKDVDISAPGEDVWHADPVNGQGKVESGNGTSYATAHLAGSAALWLAFHGKTNLQSQLKNSETLQELFHDCLVKTATKPDNWDEQKYGAGIVNLYKLLNLPPIMKLAVPAQESVLSKNGIDEGVVDVFQMIFGKQGDALTETILMFDNEFSNVLLERPDLYTKLRDLLVQNEKLGDSKWSAFKQELAPLMSEAFLDAAGWSMHSQD